MGGYVAACALRSAGKASSQPHRPHAWKQEPYMAPTLDLNIAFHPPTSGEDWLLCDGAAPMSTRGLFGWTAKVWSGPRGGQRLYRRVRHSSR
jgi:acyl-CoA thioesterase-2